MDQMRTALRGLAETATVAPADDPSALWSQGRRRVRRRRLAAVGAVAAAVVAAGALSVVVVPASVVYPAGSTHEPAIPRNVWTPQDWYPTTTDHGPPGVVAVLGGLSRDDGNGLFTVSATTGEYRLLDLPDVMDGTDGSGGPALAPDGRHIAYWLAGTPSDEPYADVMAEPGAHPTIPVGLGIYDTEDGTVQRFEPTTEHGLSADDLVWADDDTLLLTYGQRTSATSADRIATYVWDLDDPAPRGTVQTYGSRPGRSLDGALIDLRGRRRAITVPLDGGTPRQVVRLPRSRTFAAGSVWSSPEAVVVAGNELLGGPNAYGNDRTMVAPVEADGTIGRLRRVPGADAVVPVAWTDARHLLVLGSSAPGDSWGSLYSLDVATRALEHLGTAEAGMYSPGLGFATDLLDSPMVEGDRPPRLDPFWPRLGAGAVLALLAAGGIGLVRRRRRA